MTEEASPGTHSSCAKDILMALKDVSDTKTISIYVATKSDVEEIDRFILEENPFWTKFTSVHSFETAIEMFPDSIFIARDAKNTICGLVAGFPNDDLLIISYFLIRKDLRRFGFGTQLIKPVLKRAGDRNIVFSSCSPMVSTYMKYGIKSQGHQSIWSCTNYKRNFYLDDTQYTTVITKMDAQNVGSVMDYDRSLHAYQREWFVEKHIFGLDGRLVFVAYFDADVVGYGYINSFTPNSYNVVLYANDEKVAKHLLFSLLNEIPDGALLLVLAPGLDENPFSERLADAMGLKQDSEITMMYQKYPLVYQWRKTFFSDVAFITLT